MCCKCALDHWPNIFYETVNLQQCISHKLTAEQRNSKYFQQDNTKAIYAKCLMTE
jgi:hypothetical protein